MRTSKGALREGVIYDLLGRLSHEDVRERTINALMQRYSVDTDTTHIVERRARVFFTATRQEWQLDTPDWELLRWTARTHEIGLLRAIGTRRSQILGLFLGEAIMLSAIGGLAGLVIGGGGAALLGLLIPALPVHTPLQFALLAEGVAIVIGIIAGVAPARRAAGMDPVEALRAE